MPVLCHAGLASQVGKIHHAQILHYLREQKGQSESDPYTTRDELEVSCQSPEGLVAVHLVSTPPKGETNPQNSDSFKVSVAFARMAQLRAYVRS